MQSSPLLCALYSFYAIAHFIFASWGEVISSKFSVRRAMIRYAGEVTVATLSIDAVPWEQTATQYESIVENFPKCNSLFLLLTENCASHILHSCFIASSSLPSKQTIFYQCQKPTRHRHLSLISNKRFHSKEANEIK